MRAYDVLLATAGVTVQIGEPTALLLATLKIFPLALGALLLYEAKTFWKAIDRSQLGRGILSSGIPGPSDHFVHHDWNWCCSTSLCLHFGKKRRSTS